jgi:hypothetical protein
MESKQLSRSAFANILETSLPVLTHISSGRNKPGLELIQRLIEKFPDVSPDWLLTGTGSMHREKNVMPSLSTELNQLSNLKTEIETQIKAISQIEQYHRILMKEVNYLSELQAILIKNNSTSAKHMKEIENVTAAIAEKMK